MLSPRYHLKEKQIRREGRRSSSLFSLFTQNQKPKTNKQRKNNNKQHNEKHRSKFTKTASALNPKKGISIPETWLPFDLILMTGTEGKSLKPSGFELQRSKKEYEKGNADLWNREPRGEKKLLPVEGERKGIWMRLEIQWHSD